MEGFDSFTIAVLTGGALLLIIFGVMLVMDKGRPAPPASAAGKVAGKR